MHWFGTETKSNSTYGQRLNLRGSASRQKALSKANEADVSRSDVRRVYVVDPPGGASHKTRKGSGWTYAHLNVLVTGLGSCSLDADHRERGAP
jgi:hypothetical protein